MKIEKPNKTLHIFDGNTEIMNLIRTIAETQDNAFYVFNVDRIVNNFKVIKNKLPRIQPFYCK